MSDDADDNPYRIAGASRLGAVLATFSAPRRQGYRGSARVVTRVGPLGLGQQSQPLHWTRRKPGESIEVCERGVRVRGRTGLLELRWDQLEIWDRVEQGGMLLAIDLRGSHGEDVRFDRTVRGLDELYAMVAARREPRPSSP